MKMIRIAILGAALAGAVGLAGCNDRHPLSGQELKTANYAALGYAQMNGLDASPCSGLDSVNDGYVTCNMRTRDATPVSKPAVCSYEGETGGCKAK